MNILLGSNNVGLTSLYKQTDANMHWFIWYLLQTLFSIRWDMMIMNDELRRMAAKLIVAFFKVLCSWRSENSENPEELSSRI
jgi:hypothetical protein